jgi:hypothetical protein
MPAFDTFLADPSAERCWLLEIDALSIAPVTDGSQASGAFSDAAFSEVAFSEGDSGGADSGTLYYSSHGFTSQAADMPARTWYAGRLAEDVVVERKIYGRDGIGGLTRTFADCALVNADGGLDALQTNYALDGRPARLLIGRPTDARSAFNLVFSGVVELLDQADASRMRLRLSDGIARLAVPVNSTVYAGSGGLEGGADLKGKPKPRCWGNVQNLSAPLVDSANLIYQVHDGSDQRRAGGVRPRHAAHEGRRLCRSRTCRPTRHQPASTASGRPAAISGSARRRPAPARRTCSATRPAATSTRRATSCSACCSSARSTRRWSIAPRSRSSTSTRRPRLASRRWSTRRRAMWPRRCSPASAPTAASRG